MHRGGHGVAGYCILLYDFLLADIAHMINVHPYEVVPHTVPHSCSLHAKLEGLGHSQLENIEIKLKCYEGKTKGGTFHEFVTEHILSICL